MTTKTKSVSLDPRPPVVAPDSEKIVGKHPVVTPPKPMKRKRKPRSDKGKKRGTRVDKTPKTQDEPLNGVGLSANAKRLKKLYHPFDEYKKSDKWLVQVWPCWNNFDKYEIRFVFDGVRYGYKKTFDDASLAVAVGSQYLDHRYKNKGLYQS